MATTCLALTKGPVNQTVDDKASHAPLATPDRSSEAVNLSWDSTEDMHNTTPDSDLQSTAGMDDDTLWERKLMFAGIILGSTLILVLFSVCVLKCQQAKKSSKQVQPDGSGWKHEKSGESKSGGGTSYKYESLLKGKSSDNCEDDADGLGALTKEELEDALDTHQMSAEERAQRLDQWAQARAEKLRGEHATYLLLRKGILVCLTLLYIACSVLLPYLHRGEASCSHGFFWETHMQFLGIFLLTKCAELVLMVHDDTVSWEQIRVVDFLLKFLPSFLGYLDGYTDATAVFIAASCNDTLAQRLADAMGIAYLVGVCFFQWVVMFILSANDPSHACLLKLLHMDLLASCVTLPAEQRWVWDLLAAVRTIGEDMPQAILQTIYLVKVQRNFMLLSVIMAVCASLKAMHDARARALAAAGADEEYNRRERDFMIYSGSQDATIKCWNVKDGVCMKSIYAGSPANTVAASNGMLYTSHDNDVIREWSLETGEEVRTFYHEGGNAVVLSTTKYLFSWAMGPRCVYKMWSLESGECLQEFPAPDMFKATLAVRGEFLFATSAEDDSAVSQWNLTSGELMNTFGGHTDEINALVATPKRLLTGSQDGTAKEWSLVTNKCTRSFADHSSHFVAPLIVVADKLYNASDEQPDINEWSLLTGQLLRRFAGHTRPVLSIVMLEQKLYSSAEDRTIKEWSLITGACEQTFEGHTDYISKIIIMCKDD